MPSITAGDIVADKWGQKGAVLNIYPNYRSIPHTVKKYTLKWISEPLSLATINSYWVHVQYINREHGMHPLGTLKYVKVFGVHDLY